MGVIEVLSFSGLAEVLATMHPNAVVASGGASISVVVMWSWLHRNPISATWAQQRLSTTVT
eukprot:9491923-Pyramimonas_sp.AAC.1